MLSPAPYQSFSTPDWLKPKQRDRVLRIPARLMWALLFSLLFHVVIFWGFLLDLLKPNTQPQPVPMNVVLDLGFKVPDQRKQVQPPAVKPPPTPKPQPKAQPRAEKSAPPPKVIRSENPNSLFRLPPPVQTAKPEPVPVAPPAEDFSSMIKRRQNERNPNEMAAKAANEAAAAAERGPSEDERRTQTIMNNLKSGTNGLFQIRRMDPYNATFSFKGWTNNYTSANTLFYEVEARNGEDVRLVMIRRMIAIIREHYNGDFEWVSNRLGRSITLSARPEDNSGLEDFLMKEFFGPNYKNQDSLRY